MESSLLIGFRRSTDPRIPRKELIVLSNFCKLIFPFFVPFFKFSMSGVRAGFLGVGNRLFPPSRNSSSLSKSIFLDFLQIVFKLRGTIPFRSPEYRAGHLSPILPFRVLLSRTFRPEFPRLSSTF